MIASVDGQDIGKPSVSQPDRPYINGRRTRSPNEIMSISDGVAKDRRSALHDIVHAFHRANGIQNDPARFNDADYLVIVDSFQAIDPLSPHKAAIEYLSSSEGYAEIRQVKRMRQSQGEVLPEYMGPLCREIRASLNWWVQNFSKD